MNTNNEITPNCLMMSLLLRIQNILPSMRFSFSLRKQCIHVHKMMELGRLRTMHYGRANKSCSSPLNPWTFYLFQILFCSGFIARLVATLKTFGTTEADSLSTLARATVRKARAENPFGFK